MKNLIYISGPITDNRTGQPREGWEEDFCEAAMKLVGMGFEVVNPVMIAKESESQWKEFTQDGWSKRNHPTACTDMVPRYVYLFHCLQEIFRFALYGEGNLLGLYVIGDMSDISMSYGTMCEINFAMAAGLPIWSQYYNGYQMTNMLMQQSCGITLAEAAERLKRE